MRHGYRDPDANVDGNHEQLQGYSTDLLGDFARGFVTDFDQMDQRPWMLIVGPVAPHPPARPEPIYRDAPLPRWKPSPAVREGDLTDKPPHLRSFDFTIEEARRFRRRQLRTLLSVDDLVQELFTVLQEHGEISQTLAIYTSDNGYLWGEHRLRGKEQPYGPSVGVPILIRWPDEIAPGARDSRIAANIDIFPTVLDAAGLDLTLSPALDGRSLFGNDRSVILTEKLAGKYRWAGLLTKRYRYVEWYRRGASRPFFREYYSMRRDPWELRNLFGDGKKRNDPPRISCIADCNVCERAEGPSGRGLAPDRP
jgi:arylsulfatase A-like enzyme